MSSKYNQLPRDEATEDDGEVQQEGKTDGCEREEKRKAQGLAGIQSLSDGNEPNGDHNDDEQATPSTQQQQQQQQQPQKQQTMTVCGDHNDESEGEIWITVEDAMEKLGAGPFQYKILAASGLCFAADAMQVILLSFLTLVLQAEWNLSTTMTESITSCLFAGAFLGTLVIGPAADVVGRRPMFFLSATIISIFGLALSMSNNFWIFLFYLFWIGFGIGGLVVPFDLLAEFLPSQGRGRLLLSIEYFWTIGCLYVVCMAYLTLRGDERQQAMSSSEEQETVSFSNELQERTAGSGGHNWRVFVAVCTIPCVVSLVVGYFYVPESALWLAAEGHSEEALRVLRQAAVVNGHEDPFVVFPANLRLKRDESNKNASVADLFTPRWRGITFRLWGTWGGFAFGYYGAILAITKVFGSRTQMADNSNSNVTYDFDYGAIFLSSAAELVGTTMVILVVDQVGRISSQVMCYLVAGICVCSLCVLSEWGYPRYILIILGFAARVFEMGATCTSWVSTAEILTTEVRSTGHSTANAMARIGAFFCPFVVEGDMPLVRIGVIMLLVHLFTALCVCKLPETKGMEMGAAVVPSSSSPHHSEHHNNDDDDHPSANATTIEEHPIV